MGLRSRLFAGHGRTLTFLSCRKSRTDRAVWLVAWSCWRVLSGPATVLPVMSVEDLPYNRPTSPQSSLSQPIADSLSTDSGIVRSWCNSGSCCCHPVPVPQV
jgi:hypothetical protein